MHLLAARAPDAPAPHGPALAPRLLSLAPLRLADGSLNAGAPRALVRAAALECLRALLVLPYNKLHPLRAAVIAGLVPALDDPRRAVRRRAAACRSDWLTLTSGI